MNPVLSDWVMVVDSKEYHSTVSDGRFFLKKDEDISGLERITLEPLYEREVWVDSK